MTCEVAVLNKYAAVLAADSAVTYTNGDGEARYSKGGNKIFQLSHTEPVGIMIFDAAAVCGMPWEVLIKAYRNEHLKDTQFDTVADYADNFFSFLRSAASPISKEIRETSFVEGLQRAALHVVKHLEQVEPSIVDRSLPDAGRAAKAAPILAKLSAELDAEPFANAGVEAAANRALGGPPQAFREQLAQGLALGGLANVVQTDELVTLVCNLYFRRYGEYQPNTGVVVAGYGKTEYFPCVIEYSVSGFVGDEFVIKEERKASISNKTPSEILPFATASAVQAFMRGVGLDVFIQVDNAYRQFAVDFARSMLTAAKAAEPPELEQEAQKAQAEFMDSWYGNVLTSHYYPLKGVIAALPLEEMAHLAETLVTLESLKERVTSPTQSVGGPIDVAVITKSEGLVWIKRKHYFDSDKNMRFVMRQRAIFQ